MSLGKNNHADRRKQRQRFTERTHSLCKHISRDKELKRLADPTQFYLLSDPTSDKPKDQPVQLSPGSSISQIKSVSMYFIY